jgi:GNAT acetyltransferase-like protein
MGLKNYKVTRYKNTDAPAWNTFLRTANNATFLLNRNFMDYHADRFSDFSLMIYKEDKLVAVLPANADNQLLFSHQGLTYGGLIYGSLKLQDVILVFREILFFLQQHGFSKLYYKSVPSIYCNKPAQEIDYALFLAKAELVRRDSLSVLDNNRQNEVSDLRKRGIKKGLKNGLVIKEESNFKDFWNNILIPNLESRHQAKPVHSVEEIQLLAEAFPENIRQFNVYYGNDIIAGTTVFETENVVHAQYIAANETRADFGSLDFLFHELIHDTFRGKKYFDFGISNEAQGRKLNSGLSYWKESFGATTVIHDFYEVAAENYILLDDVFI